MARSVFPLIKNDSITIEIFSFVDTIKLSKDLLRRLNSKGRQLALEPAYNSYFVTYLKS